MTTLFYQISKEYWLYFYFLYVWSQCLCSRRELVRSDYCDLFVCKTVSFSLQGSGFTHPNTSGHHTEQLSWVRNTQTLFASLRVQGSQLLFPASGNSVHPLVGGGMSQLLLSP